MILPKKSLNYCMKSRTKNKRKWGDKMSYYMWSINGIFFDIQDHVSEIGIEDLSLQKIYANLFGGKISKSQRLTNWEADILSDGQKVYAATDAWSCIKIYEELQRLEATGDFELIRQEDNVQESISQEG